MELTDYTSEQIQVTIKCTKCKLIDIYHACFNNCKYSNCSNDLCDDIQCCMHFRQHCHSELDINELTLMIEVPTALKEFIKTIDLVISIGNLFKEIDLMNKHIDLLKDAVNALLLFHIASTYICKRSMNRSHRILDYIKFVNIDNPIMKFYSNIDDMKYTVKLIMSKVQNLPCCVCTASPHHQFVFNFCQNCNMYNQPHILIAIISRLCNNMINMTKPNSQEFI